MNERRLPDFLIAGAPRCGTTWLYHLLRRHGDIYLAEPLTPEPKFFLVDELYARGLDYYSQTWFAAAPEGAMAGEKSTNYLESPAAAERIAHDLPHIKLVFIFRNPIERAYSNYLWSRKNGLEQESFAVALASESQREAQLPKQWRFTRPHAYFSRGLYARLLEPYLRRFGADQILCMRFEDIRECARDVADRLHRFLGVAPRPEDADGLGPVNESEPAAPPLAAETRAALADRYAAENERLQTLLGGEWWPE